MHAVNQITGIRTKLEMRAMLEEAKQVERSVEEGELGPVWNLLKRARKSNNKGKKKKRSKNVTMEDDQGNKYFDAESINKLWLQHMTSEFHVNSINVKSKMRAALSLVDSGE